MNLWTRFKEWRKKQRYIREYPMFSECEWKIMWIKRYEADPDYWAAKGMNVPAFVAMERSWVLRHMQRLMPSSQAELMVQFLE